MSDLKGQVALITGGGDGIGAATAEAFVHRGAKVLVTYRSNPSGAHSLIEKLPGDGHRAIYCDVTDTASLRELTGDVLAKERFITYLVNNAGWTKIVPHGNLDDLTDDVIVTTFNVNTIGLLKVCRELAGVLRAAPPGGAIINISSVAAQINMGSSIAYCASKAGVDSITQTLARVFSPGIRVMGVAPGLTRTKMSSQWTSAEIAQRVQNNAMKRMAEPTEIAAAIVHVAADFKYSTGSTVLVEGGRMLY